MTTYGKFCPNFYNFLEVTMDGECWMCCPSWLRKSIGNIITAEDFMRDVWNGPTAQAIRNQVNLPQWNMCDQELCPKIVQNQLYDVKDLDQITELSDIQKQTARRRHLIVRDLPTMINFSEDRSCNLFCPSCRIEKIMYNPGNPIYEHKRMINQKIVGIFLTEPTDRKFTIRVTGSGDPFASKIYRDMLTNINGEDFPNLTINLTTNGVMFTPKMWHKLHRIHANITDCRISFDAGTKHTYENVTRLGGDWDQLLDNCKHLNELSKTYPLRLHYDFVVQDSNYMEMAGFVKLIFEKFDNASSVCFSRVNDWNTWDTDTYRQKTVWDPFHPAHADLLTVLQDEIFDDPRVFLGNLAPLRKKLTHKL